MIARIRQLKREIDRVRDLAGMSTPSIVIAVIRPDDDVVFEVHAGPDAITADTRDDDASADGGMEFDDLPALPADDTPALEMEPDIEPTPANSYRCTEDFGKATRIVTRIIKRFPGMPREHVAAARAEYEAGPMRRDIAAFVKRERRRLRHEREAA